MNIFSRYYTKKKIREELEYHKLFKQTNGKSGKPLYFWRENLYKYDFSNEDLSDVIFNECILYEVNFCGANLKNTKFIHCYDINTIITNENTLPKMICPEDCNFIGYSPCDIRKNKTLTQHCIVKLLIPENAKRSSSTTNKCRCDMARVLAISDIYGKELEMELLSDKEKRVLLKQCSYNEFHEEFQVGEIVYSDYFSENRWVENDRGIYFFMNFEEAIDFGNALIRIGRIK